MLDPDFGPDADTDADADDEFDADSVEWLEDAAQDEVDAGSSVLPPRTTRRRLVGSLLLVGCVLAATGYGVHAVYQRDAALEAAENELILGPATSSGSAVLDTGARAARTTWTEHPRVGIRIPVVNRGPDPVTLLPGATLVGAGLLGSSLSAGSGARATVLGPGRSTVLAGYVTADCVFSGPDTGTAAATSLSVTARTSGGGVGVSAVPVDAGTNAGSIRDRICRSQDDALADFDMTQWVRPGSRSFMLAFTVVSHADVPLDYTFSLSDGGSGWLTYVPVSHGPVSGTPAEPATGVLAPAGTATVGYTFTITDCTRAMQSIRMPTSLDGDPAGSPGSAVQVRVRARLSVGTDALGTPEADAYLSSMVELLCG